MADAEWAWARLNWCSTVLKGTAYTIAAAIAIIGLVNPSCDDCEHIVKAATFWVVLVITVIQIILSCLVGNANYLDPYSAVFVKFVETLCSLILFVYTLWTFIAVLVTISHKGGGEALPGESYKEYSLNEYSMRWSEIKECLVQDHACERMIVGDWANTTLTQFYTKRLSSVESGCCKPSNDCNFSYISPTNWTQTINSTYTNPDCRSWDNNPNVLCFDCLSCKAAVLDNFKSNRIIQTFVQ